MHSTALPPLVRRLAVAAAVAVVLLGSALVVADVGERTAAEARGAVPLRTTVAAWSTALNRGGRGFDGQSIREVVHLSAGGDEVRLQLSNLRGTSTLVVGRVGVAVQAQGGVPVPGSHREVTFGSASGLFLDPGTEQASDAVAMNVVAGQSLLVSIYVANKVATTSWHPKALATTWISKTGDHTAADTLTAYPTRTTASYLLGGVWVTGGTARGTVVAIGDSITDGVRSTVDENRRYPDALARRFAGQPGGPGWSVVNVGINGNRLQLDGSASTGISGVRRFARDALAQPGVSTVVLLEGINDIITVADPAAAPIIAGYQTVIDQAHAARVRIVGATVLPFEGSSRYNAARESVRQQLNFWIRTSGAFDAVADLDAVLRDPTDMTRLRAGYDSGDHIHPNDDGYEAMADAMPLKALSS